MSKLRAAAAAAVVFAVVTLPGMAYAQTTPPDVGDTVGPLFNSGLTSWIDAVTDLLPWIIAAGLILSFAAFVVRRFSRA